jgi:antitoxin Phd
MSNKRRSTTSDRHSLRESQGESARFTATQAKNEFGRVLEMVLQGGAVVITKHDAPKAIMISIDEFHKLSQSSELALDALSKEFDAFLARLQSPKARAAMKEAFAASPMELGKAAVAAARKRA